MHAKADNVAIKIHMSECCDAYLKERVYQSHWACRLLVWPWPRRALVGARREILQAKTVQCGKKKVPSFQLSLLNYSVEWFSLA